MMKHLKKRINTEVTTLKKCNSKDRKKNFFSPFFKTFLFTLFLLILHCYQNDAHRNIHCRVVYLLHGVTPILRTGRLLSFLCGKKKNDKNSQEKTKVKDNDGKQTNKNSIKEAKKKKKAHVNALLKDYFNAKNDEEREKQYDLIRYTCEKENLDFGKMIYNYYICNVKKSKFSCIRDILFLLSISMIAGSITLGVTTALSIVNLPGVAVALAISSFVGLYALDLFSH